MTKSTYLLWQRPVITLTQRQSFLRQTPRLFWFTGLSGAGKSTLAYALEERLHAQGHLTYVLDGDNVRHGLCHDLNFTPEDRTENIRRIAEVSKLFLDAGLICMAAFISPTHADRDQVRALVGAEHFFEIYIRCPLSICEARDVKGNYKKARAGIIPHYTGISAPYEEPEHPALIVDTDETSIEDGVNTVLEFALHKIRYTPQT